MWKLDLKDKWIHKFIQEHTYICVCMIALGGEIETPKGGRKRQENDRVNNRNTLQLCMKTAYWISLKLVE
jgi:hypothetical protein